MELKGCQCEVCGYSRLIKCDDYYVCEACGAVKYEVANNEQDSDYADAIKYLECTPPNFEAAESRFNLIVEKYPTWSSGYWGRILAKFGIKYEYDKGQAVPTCYFDSYEDIRDCDDYKKAIKYADDKLKQKYEAEASKIALVAKTWRERPLKQKYDLFISFKGTDDETNQDTSDRSEMRELYYYLTNRGFKVFFSDISLNDNGIYGRGCEPYIFEAIHSTKAMLVYGSKPEFFNSTWVQNEWQRYNNEIANGHKKEGSLIVAYEGFDARELPLALRRIQAIKADSRHFYSDLVEIISKYVDKTDNKANNTRFCKHCGIELNPNAKFCPNCGKPYVSSLNEGIKCPNCSSLNQNNSRFCFSCGYKLIDDSQKQSTSDELKKLEEAKRLEEEKLKIYKIKAEKEKYKEEYERNHKKSETKTNENKTVNKLKVEKRVESTNPEYRKIKRDLEKYYKGKDPWYIFFLCLFLGGFGVHHFAREDYLRGFLFLFTLGGFFFGWIFSTIIHFLKACQWSIVKRS